MIKTEDKVVNIYIYGAEVNHLWCRSEPFMVQKWTIYGAEVNHWYGIGTVIWYW